jgi:citrate synthase
MNEDQTIINTGLRGVTVASTKISDVDGIAGKLIYRGYLVGDLAADSTFEEVAHLLLYEQLPNRKQLMDFKRLLVSERGLPEPMVNALKDLPGDALPMDVLQASVSMLGAFDPDSREAGKEAALRMGIRLIAKMPTVIAAWHRIRTGNDPIAPNPELDHAANFLFMLNGRSPETQTARYFDVALVLHAEHSFNASTFSARQVASTRAHIYSAVAAAVGSLSGELHGGANVRVMEMLKEIGSPENIDRYIQQALDAGQLIFGLGHAVYKTDDPRAKILAPMAKETGERIGEPMWYEISRELEVKAKEAFRQRKNLEIFTNVDFYSASLYNAMGIPIDLFTPVFAMSRVSGWAAHVLEEQFAGAAPKPALYRPESEYIGDYCGPQECVFVPVENR